MFKNLLRKNSSKTDTMTTPDKIHGWDATNGFINVTEKEMDTLFTREAGRYCEACGFHGSHHTEAHNDFARTAKVYHAL